VNTTTATECRNLLHCGPSLRRDQSGVHPNRLVTGPGLHPPKSLFPARNEEWSSEEIIQRTIKKPPCD
jgi:hypothetical protein